MSKHAATSHVKYLVPNADMVLRESVAQRDAPFEHLVQPK